jgi:flagellar basal body rod protein FlgG
MLNQDVVARNLAHVSVPGFRRTGLAYETFENAEQERFGTDSNLGTQVPKTHTDFTPGAIQKTGRPLDLAIRGDGFFELDGGDGSLYTRNGVFHLNSDGELVNGEGLAVLGDNDRPIVLPDVTPSQITVSRDGGVFVGDIQRGKLSIVRFDDNQQLTPAGTTTFRAPPGTVAEAADEDVAVEQGSREMANVSAVEELVRLLAGLRYSEASQRALRTIGDIIAKRMERQ